jgi:tetraacyldisaccharide 4'-kinase
MALRAPLEALLSRHWWQPRPTVLAWVLWPLSVVFGMLLRRAQARHLHHRPSADVQPVPVPVLVVGNLVVGGAGKTPTVVAVVQALQRRGHRPGVITRGHGRAAENSNEVTWVKRGDEPARVGDEPLLIQRRTQVPVWVGRQRAAVARALCVAHPEVDVLVSDDGLQHAALPRQAELVVFDERGAGNGLLLPAGPLREPLPRQVPPQRHVLYTAGRASTPLPGSLAQRRLGLACPLAAWQAGRSSEARPLAALQGRPLLAMAGLAAPEKFFGMLEAEGLLITRLPLPDHHPYRSWPWPAGTTELVTTEKDAVKLAGRDLGHVAVWVVPLDLTLPEALVDALSALLFPTPAPPAPPRPLPPPP